MEIFYSPTLELIGYGEIFNDEVNLSIKVFKPY